MSITGQSPEKSQHADFLNKSSLKGSRVVLKLQSSGISDSFTLGAGGTGDIRFNLSTWADTADTILIPYDDILAWHEVSFYIDVNDEAHRMFTGSALTSAQRNITLGKYTETDPDGYSYVEVVGLKNNDSGSHTIFWLGLWKGIVVGQF